MGESRWERYQANVAAVRFKTTAVRYHSFLAVTSVLVLWFSMLFVEASAFLDTQVQSEYSAEDTVWISDYLFPDERRNPTTGLDAFLGEWKEIKKQNFDELATAIGLTDEQRQFFANHGAVLSYTRYGNKWCIHRRNTHSKNSHSCNFTFGQPYTTLSLNGTPMSCIPTQNGRTMSETCKVSAPQDYDMTIDKSVHGNRLICTLTVGRKSMRLILERAKV